MLTQLPSGLRPCKCMHPRRLPSPFKPLFQRRNTLPGGRSVSLQATNPFYQPTIELSTSILQTTANARHDLGDLTFRSVPVSEISEGLETPLQLVYLVMLLGLLSVGAYLVVRQVLVRRELDEAAKALGERIRTGNASCEDYFELGVILTRKKLFTQATKNLDKARKLWDGEETELAQNDMAIKEYRTAVEFQPGYVTAWNNLGDALEKEKDWRSALQAYSEALSYAPDNKVAMQRAESVRTRMERLGISM